MNIKDILTISGQPGLYKLVSKGKNAIIVENLETGKRMPSHANNRTSALEDISIFTEADELPLKDLFAKIYEKEQGKPTEEPKKFSNDALKAYFAELVPNYDTERVYTSDMKKALQWYNLLLAKGHMEMEEEVEEPKKEEAPDSADTKD